MVIFRTFRSRILFIVLGSFLIFSLFLSISSVSFNYTQIKIESEEKLMNMVRHQTLLIDEMFIQRKTSGNFLQNYISDTVDPDRMQKDRGYYLSYKEELEPIINALAEENKDAWFFFNPDLNGEAHDIWFAADESGKMFRLPEKDLEFYSVRENREWFFDARDQRKNLWFNPYLSQTEEFTGEYWITYSCPVYVDDIFIGVGGHDIYFSDLVKSLEQISIYGTGYAILLNDHHDFLIHPTLTQDVSASTYKDGTYRWMSDRMDMEATGILEYVWEGGENKLMAYSRLSNNWILAVTANKRIIYEPLYRQIYRLLFMLLVFMGFFIVLIYRLTSHLASGLEHLISAIAQTGAGQYELPIPEEFYTDATEVGILARTVEAMRQRQNRSFNEIQKYNEELESMVLERTDELEEKKRHLEDSLEALQVAQKKLIESERFEASNHILMELAHRLNTPLGNAKLTSSIIQDRVAELIQMEPQKRCSWVEENKNLLEETLGHIRHSIEQSIKIIQGLQEVTKEAEQKSEEILSLKQFLNFTFSHYRIAHDDEIPEFSLDCPEDITLHTNPDILLKVMKNLYTYSQEESMKGSDIKEINIFVRVKGSTVFLEYHDSSSLEYSDMNEHVFEPYSYRSFKSDEKGIEMHLVYFLVRSVLSGEITCLENAEGKPYFLIELPSASF